MTPTECSLCRHTVKRSAVAPTHLTKPCRGYNHHIPSLPKMIDCHAIRTPCTIHSGQSVMHIVSEVVESSTTRRNTQEHPRRSDTLTIQTSLCLALCLMSPTALLPCGPIRPDGDGWPTHGCPRSPLLHPVGTVC
jgi:hypothetical protein